MVKFFYLMGINWLNVSSISLVFNKCFHVGDKIYLLLAVLLVDKESINIKFWFVLCNFDRSQAADAILLQGFY